MAHPTLIYVEESWAYFGDLDEAWGDDWDDAPYEHNAGTPYEFAFKVAFDGPWETPSSNVINSEWSVEAINAGRVPWLRTDRYDRRPDVSIPAGVTVSEFRRLIEEGGGHLFVPLDGVPGLYAPEAMPA